ncbi:unnamed protein product [Meganyctiphanes norvegica]|uniref:Uncharacterized protein n=1 Tax=Meganyctiphanes norvegica TaxID=48144 RepID=A0AAV2RXN9_MEGNR
MAGSDVLSIVVQELNLQRNYCRTTPLIDTVECFINAPWIRGIIRDGILSEMCVHETLSTTEVQSALQLGESIGHLWQRVNVQVIIIFLILIVIDITCFPF